MKTTRTSRQLVIVLVLLLSTLLTATTGLAAPAASAPALAPSAPLAGNACVTLQPDETAGKDAYIKQENVNERRGGDPELRVKTESGKLMRSLLQFDLSSLPANASVTSAVLSLWVKDVNGNVSAIRAHQVTSSWNEAEVTWNSVDDAAAVSWTSPGGDYSNTVLDSEAFVNGVKDYWATWNVAAAAQAWVDDPAANFGVILEAPVSDPKNETKFKSSDDGTASEHPTLEVCYTELLPDLQIDKTLTTAGPIYVGQEISFAIVLTNTGQTTLDFIPLRDWYDPQVLQLVGATPAPDTVSNGALIWDDLAVSLGALAPGATTAVEVRFKALKATTNTALAAAASAAGQPAQSFSTQAPAGGTPVLDTCGYPYSSTEPRTSVVFNESYILRAFSPSNGGAATPSDTIKVWYNDEHALALGVRQVQIKTAGGTTITDYPITPMLVQPADHAVNPLVGTTTTLTGDQAGSDLVGRPIWPALFITDITNNPNSRTGDWQFGGMPIAPDDVFGSWKGAVRLVDKTRTPNVVTVTPDADPAKNNWNLAGGEAPPAGVDNEGFGALMRWNVNGLLTPGHTYRIQVMIHDGDQNKAGGDSGEACTTIAMASTGSIGDRVWYDANGDKAQQATEPGLNGVKVSLYGGACPATGAPQKTLTTASDGNYDFVGLTAGSYCVAVDASTLPPGFALTTANEPKTVMLATLQDYNDADFGYRAQCPDGTPNLAMVSGVRDQYDTFVTAHQDYACVQIQPGGKYEISKQLTTPGPSYVGQTVSFTIRITNTGNTTITELPLQDLYDTTTLSYLDATPASDDNADDGVINWSDLTVSLGDLRPGNSLTVAVRFRALQATSSTVLAAAAGANIPAFAATETQLTKPSAVPLLAAGPAAGDALDAVDTCGYPYTSSEPRTSTIFNESYILRAFSPTDGGIAAPGDTIKVWYNDEHALALGVRQVQVKTASGTTPTNYPITAMSVSPADHVAAPQVGTMALSGDQAGTDQSNRPMWPALFITDITNNPNSRIGDWQNGGLPIPPHDVFGSWKGAVRFVDKTKNPAEVSVTPDADPAKNNWNLAGGEAPPAGVDDEGFSALMRWNVNALLTPGHTYRIQVMIHDGDQNKTGGDSGEACTTIMMAPPGTIGDRVFQDASGTGLPDDGTRPGIGGVKVKLFAGACPAVGSPMATATTTSPHGDYYFVNLPAGAYCVDVDQSTLPPSPGGWALTTANDPHTVNIAPGESHLMADFGYKPVGTASIGDRVFYDADKSGLPDNNPEEAGISGATVRLYSGTCPAVGSPVATQVTAANGGYLFQNLVAGTYCVDVDPSTLPAGYELTTANAPKQVSLTNGQSYRDADFGYRVQCSVGTPNLAIVRNAVDSTGSTLADSQDDACAQIIAIPSAIGDFVWYDTDGDGIEDVGEPGIPNVTLALYRDADGDGFLDLGLDAFVTNTVTDADGGYLFPGLAPGVYFITVTDANGRLTDLMQVVGNQAQPDPTDGIVLTAGEVYKDADFGYQREPVNGDGIIGDAVWYDANNDGVQQPNEPGMSGIRVCATSVGSGLEYCDITDANGRYLIEVPTGAYNVAPKNPPLGLTASTPTTVGPVIIVAGEQYLDADFGYWDRLHIATGAAGNLVFRDVNKNGRYEPGLGETPLAGVSVDLIKDEDGNGAWDAGEPIVATTTTVGVVDGNNGNYLFPAVPAGTYLMHVSDTNSVLIDYEKSLGSNGVDGNSQGDPYGLTVPVNGANLTADFGYYPANRQNIGVIGNQVWTETDQNGLFNPGGTDVGQAGVTVELLRGGNVISTTTTGASGDYAFTSLPGGSYQVRVTDSYGVLMKYDVTTLGANQGQDNNNELQPYSVNLAQGGYNLTADFGYKLKPGDIVSSSSIGNLVWHDLNGDGRRQGTEPGIGNVTMALWYDTDKSCTQNVGDFPIMSKTTSGVVVLGGNYQFDGEFPTGNYLVLVTDTGNVLSGYTKGTGPTPGADNNSQAQPYCLVNFNPLGTGASNMTSDFGYYRPVTIGDFIYFDSNGNGTQQANETTGINGAPVTVRNVGTNATTTVTSNNGAYLVTNLPPGTYEVSVPATQPGLVRTTASPKQVTLTSGQTDLLQDFGYIAPTATMLASFVAERTEAGVVVRWTTSYEQDVVSFVVWRAQAVDGEYQAVSGAISAANAAEGASYEWVDGSAEAGQSYWYKLVSKPDGQVFGPVGVTGEEALRRIFTPFVLR